MGLFDDLLTAAQQAPPLRVADVVVGPRFTALAARVGARSSEPLAGGVAYTNAGDLTPDFDAGQATARLRPQLLGRCVFDVARTLHTSAERWPEDNTGVAPGSGTDLGIAALNSLLGAHLSRRGLGDENGLDLIAHFGAGRRLAIVGRFPYLARLRAGAVQSWVLELTPEEGELPAGAAAEVLPQADVVGITGSAFANGTLEELLALCRPDAFVAVIGPTTPLSPVLFDYGVDVLCGALMERPREALASFAVSGSTRRLPGMRQVSYRRE